VETPAFMHGGKAQAILIAVTIIASGLLDLVYLCNVLSMGQLPSQVLQPCTHNGFTREVPPFRGEVSFDNVRGR
jgi:hypothetical protein